MFVVDYTPAGFPIGVFEDEMDRDRNDGGGAAGRAVTAEALAAVTESHTGINLRVDDPTSRWCAAIGATHLLWRAGPLEDVHAGLGKPGGISDADMMRANVITTRHVADAFAGDGCDWRRLATELTDTDRPIGANGARRTGPGPGGPSLPSMPRSGTPRTATPMWQPAAQPVALRTPSRQLRTPAEATAHRADLAGGVARAALTALEMALALAEADGRREVGLDDVERARQSRILRYGEDEHYDVISAFIKAIRGSDPDAGLYWLARILQAGEDARFIARRLVILASEDVGVADSMGLMVADAAARAVEFVGLPEAQLNLAHAVVYVATAPKSNTVTAALIRASEDVSQRPAGPVPGPLRSVPPHQRRKMGEGGGYVYPHNDPSGFVPQEYRPQEVAGRVYYRPSPHGHEADIGTRLRRLWGDAAYDSEEW